MAYRANVKDIDQTVLEEAESEEGVLVFDDAKTRVVVRGRGGTQKTNNAGTNIGSNAGVVMTHDDNSNNKFADNTPGKP